MGGWWARLGRFFWYRNNNIVVIIMVVWFVDYGNGTVRVFVIGVSYNMAFIICCSACRWASKQGSNFHRILLVGGDFGISCGAVGG